MAGRQAGSAGCGDDCGGRGMMTARLFMLGTSGRGLPMHVLDPKVNLVWENWAREGKAEVYSD